MGKTQADLPLHNGRQTSHVATFCRHPALPRSDGGAQCLYRKNFRILSLKIVHFNIGHRIGYFVFTGVVSQHYGTGWWFCNRATSNSPKCIITIKTRGKSDLTICGLYTKILIEDHITCQYLQYHGRCTRTISTKTQWSKRKCLATNGCYKSTRTITVMLRRRKSANLSYLFVRLFWLASS